MGGSGGAWKVAYADFVTAMMALFLVLWLVGSDIEVRKEIELFFQGRDGAMKKPGKLRPAGSDGINLVPQDQSGAQLVQVTQLHRSFERIRQQLNNSDQPGDDFIRFEFLADGLRIIAIDRAKKPFFHAGSSELTQFGSWVLRTIAWEVERHPFMVEVEGHVEKEGDVQDHMTGWDLSTQRAVTAHLALTKGGVEEKMFWRVAGYSDRVPLNEHQPHAEENRRITVVVRLNPDDDMKYIQDAFLRQ